MIPRVGDFVPFGADSSPVRRVDLREALAEATRPTASPDDGLSEAVRRSFRLTLLEALRRAPRPEAGPAAAPSLPGAAPPLSAGDGVEAPADAGPAPGTPGDVTAVIKETAGRAGIDGRFLQALRRVENGGAGREFGVLSVPAPTYEDQARVAAESVRRNVERFERATGRDAVDPVSGQYTEEFIRFFSTRWAPIGADNDPTGLNRYHARNLIRIYAQLNPQGE